jgi:ubiquinone biosynthesis protein COQ9
LQIFSVDKFLKLLLRLVMAEFFTSGSLSFKSKANVWMRLLSLISFPNASANLAKLLAKQRRTFQDLSSPAARSVPRV